MLGLHSLDSTHADFEVRSVPDNTLFPVLRHCLKASNIFQDMFTCCDTELATNGFKQCLDLHETAYTLDILLYILHTLPQIPGSSSADYAPIYTGFPNQVIPFPLLFRLSDKYVLPVAFVNDLRFRLAAYALTCPLRAYGYAVELGMDEIAAEASSHLLSPPLATYTLEDISVIPKVAAYHALLSLHEFRARKLREVLMDEPLFPYGYGECPKHGQKTNLQWEQWKVDLLPKVHAGMNIADEMMKAKENFEVCDMCRTACTRAVSMIKYKCDKIIKKVNELPA